MKALIIDFTNPLEVKILNTRVTSSVTIHAGYYMALSQGDDAIEIAASKLKQENLLDIPAYIIPPRDFMQSHVFHLPRMPDKEINKVLPREIADVSDSRETMVYNYFKNGMVREKMVEKLEIACFFTPQKRAFEFLNRLKSKGINPVKIIPEVQGLKSLLETNKELAGERDGVVFLELMGSRINLNIFKSSFWSLEREFPFHFEVSDQLTEEDLSRISIELNRTFQYFKQRNRTYGVNKVLLYGSNTNIKHLKEFIADNHPVHAEIVNPGLFKAKIVFPPHLKEKDEFLLLFTTCVSVAMSMTRKKVLDLFPREFTEKERLPRRLLGLSISAIVVGSILIGSTIWFERVRASYKKDIRDLQKTYLSLSKNAATIENTKHLRIDYFKKRFFAEIPVRYSYGAADFVRRLSQIVTEKVSLTNLDIDPRGQDFSFVLNGSIIADDNIGAQAEFLRFYQQLKEFEDMIDITFSTIKVNAGESAEAGASRGRSGPRDTGTARRMGGTESPPEQTQNQVELYFTIKGEVELE